LTGYLENRTAPIVLSNLPARLKEVGTYHEHAPVFRFDPERTWTVFGDNLDTDNDVGLDGPNIDARRPKVGDGVVPRTSGTALVPGTETDWDPNAPPGPPPRQWRMANLEHAGAMLDPRVLPAVLRVVEHADP
jgi:hypothetical protein